MRQAAALALTAVAALALQGFLAVLLPGLIVPDLTLLATVTGAVVLPPVPALCFAVGLGYGADLLSGSLLGQQALARLLAFAATLVVSGQFQLARGFPLFVFVLGLGLVDALWVEAAGRLLGDVPPVGVWALGTAACRAFATAGLAPFALGRMQRLRELLLEVDARRREVRLETRRPVL